MDITVRGTGITVSERNSLITISYQLLILPPAFCIYGFSCFPRYAKGWFFYGKIMKTTILYKAFRPTTESVIKGIIPEEIGTDPDDCEQWIGEEYNGQFLPAEFKIVTLREKDMT